MFDAGQVRVTVCYKLCNLNKRSVTQQARRMMCILIFNALYPQNFTVQLGLMPFSTRDEASVYNSLAHSDVVVNMIGKHYETKHIVPTRRANGKISRVNFDMEEVNVTIPRMLARQAREAGVTCFIHLSGAFRIQSKGLTVWYL